MRLSPVLFVHLRLKIVSMVMLDIVKPIASLAFFDPAHPPDPPIPVQPVAPFVDDQVNVVLTEAEPPKGFPLKVTTGTGSGNVVKLASAVYDVPIIFEA